MLGMHVTLTKVEAAQDVCRRLLALVACDDAAVARLPLRDGARDEAHACVDDQHLRAGEDVGIHEDLAERVLAQVAARKDSTAEWLDDIDTLRGLPLTHQILLGFLRR